MSMIKPRTAVVTIYAGDYLDQIRFLEQKAEAALASVDGLPRTNDETPEYLALAAEHDALVAEAEESATHITLQALPRKVWKALVAAHPPRKSTPDKVVSAGDERGDALVGFNEETLSEALICGGTVDIDGHPVAYGSIVSPELDQDDLDEISHIDFQRLYFAAFALNRGQIEDPKAGLVSRLTQRSDATSN